MRNIKREIAAILTALLMFPGQPVSAAPETSLKTYENVETTETMVTGKEDKATPDDVGREEKKATSDTAEKADKLEKTEKADETEEVRFNTGNYEFSVVSREDFIDNGLGDACFEEDGSYTINIPEENPFFPYEVQFTYDGKRTKEWFMTPDDTVEIDGHTFYISAMFDNTVVTQMSLKIAGDTVVVYPKEKMFNNYGDGIMPLSLLPLTEIELEADLADYTPVELTMVSLDSVFMGDRELTGEDKVSWCYENDGEYRINALGDMMNLSWNTDDSSLVKWQMIVGDDNQLAAENTRCIVDLKVTRSNHWLIPTVYQEDAAGKRTSVTVVSEYYRNNMWRNHSISVGISDNDIDWEAERYLGLKINDNLFGSNKGTYLKAYEGFGDLENPLSGRDITDEILAEDMAQPGAGFRFKADMKITLAMYDSEGKVTGILPLDVMPHRELNQMFSEWLYEKTETTTYSVVSDNETERKDGVSIETCFLEEEYPLDGTYYKRFEYYQGNVSNPSAVTAAYAGNYSSIAEAEAAEAEDIKEALFAEDKFTGGYAGDYSKGIYFTIFVGEDGSQKQEVYKYCIKTKRAEIKPEEPEKPSSGTGVTFYGLTSKDGDIRCYSVNSKEDSYADYNYITIMVEEEVDLTAIAPKFSCAKGVTLYTSGSSTPEVSGKSMHDFSKGPVQYTSSAENKKDSKNFWLQVVKATDEDGKLYINSLADKDAKTKKENGVIYSTREIFLDNIHDDIHDILLINLGKTGIPDLSAELSSDVVELDDYWTLKGGYELAGFSTIDDETYYGELPNLAKLRIVAKEGAEGKDVSGTLTIKSGDTVLMVLTLTGLVGDPRIITTGIPQAVKYVPYGTMIQNNNKYRDNQVSYSLIGGKLPEGMVVKENGEIYGVPTETGSFAFAVRMENSKGNLSSSSMRYTLIVNENTDTNVDAATDPGYDVLQRIQDITLNSSNDQTFVSKGVYNEFTDVFLDGKKLQPGVDYTSESGSTRITIKSQTLKVSNTPGTHTLGVEFRTGDTNKLNRAAQNYRVKDSGNGSGSGSGSGSSSGSSGSVSGVSTTGKGVTANDSKKGVVDAERGIITGSGAGYSRWEQNENGWKLIYADGTTAGGYMAELADGSAVEQVLWEKVNGSWYAFGADGYLKSGWVYDYQLNSWYSVSTDSGMRTGWYKDIQDNCTYYLDLAAGNMALGWRQIDGKWYYFNQITPVPTWKFDQNTGTWVYDVTSKYKPYGSMYYKETTPDGYYVDSNGFWDEKGK